MMKENKLSVLYKIWTSFDFCDIHTTEIYMKFLNKLTFFSRKTGKNRQNM